MENMEEDDTGIVPLGHPKDVQELAAAINDMTIMERLKFVRRILCSRAGEPDEPDYDKAMAVAAEVMSAAIENLIHAPQAFHEWDSPHPV